MKSDKELLRIWKRKERTTRDYWRYFNLTSEEKERLFDLISQTTKL